MTPGLLLPAALAALAALIVPLIIHIARRSEQQPTDFAALRWLRQKPRPRSRLRFDEWPLLLLRLALLILLALWLAQPVLFGAGGKTRYVAVAPGADLAQARAAAGEGATLHWLAPGFPDVKQPKPESGAPLASLVRQLDADLPPGASLTIVVPQVIEGADAERPRLSRTVDWRIVAGAMPATPAAVPPVRALSIRSDAGLGAGVRYLRAAAFAWQPAGREADVEIAALDAALPKTTRALVWLGAGTLPAALLQWVEAGGTAIIAADAQFPEDAPRAVLWRDDLGRPLAEARPLGAGRLMRFTRRLAPSEMPELLQPDFPVRLRALFDPLPTAPSRASSVDYAPLTGGRSYVQAPQDIRPWLALLIGGLLLIERWVATRRCRMLGA